MDELIRWFNLGESATPTITILEVLFGVLLAAALGLIIGLVYRRVQAEGAYSQALVHTMVLMAMITCLIMLIIGSNIARAFSLVGALSIIRFRTAIKSPLDVGFLFFSMAVGMACGTGFSGTAILGTAIIATVITLMRQFNYAAYPQRKEFLLSVVFHLDTDYGAALDPLLGNFFDAYSFAYAETVRQGTLREVVYSVRPKQGIKDQDIMDAVREVNGNLKVAYRTVRHAIEVP